MFYKQNNPHIQNTFNNFFTCIILGYNIDPNGIGVALISYFCNFNLSQLSIYAISLFMK